MINSTLSPETDFEMKSALNVFSINFPSTLVRYTTLLVSFGVSALRDIPKSVCLPVNFTCVMFSLVSSRATLTDNLIAAPSSTPTMLPLSSKFFTQSDTE